MIELLRRIRRKLSGQKPNPTLRLGSAPSFYGSQFADHVGVGYGSLIVHSTIGLHSYLGMRCIVAHAEIGRFCSIAADVTIGTGRHPIDRNVAMHPAFYLRRLPEWDFVLSDSHEEFRRTSVGNDVWIGNKAIILDGVTVGDGVVIGAGSVVTHDLAPYGIYAGVPAKLLRYRFSESQIDRLLKLRWWDKDLTWIRENATEFADVDDFLGKFEH